MEKEIFCYLLLDFHVKTGTRFSLRDKRVFEISEVEIMRVDCSKIQSRKTRVYCEIMYLRLSTCVRYPHGCVLAINPVSILRKSISGRHRPVRVADGPMTARCRFT